MNHPQRSTLTISLILQIALAVGLTGWFCWRRTEKVVAEVATELLEDINNQVEKRVYGFLTVPSAINNIIFDGVQLKAVNLSELISIQNYLKGHFESYSLLESINTIGYGNYQGKYVGVGRSPEDDSLVLKQTVDNDLHVYSINEQHQPDKLLNINPNYDPRVRPWYQTTAENRRASWSPVYIMFSYPYPGITLSLPIYNRARKLLGVIGTDVLLKDISSFLSTLKTGETGKVYIVERSGKVIATSEGQKLIFQDQDRDYQRVSWQQLEPNLADRIDLTKIQDVDLLTLKSPQEKYKQRFVRITPIQDDWGLDWLLVSTVSESEFSAIYARNWRSTSIICLLVLLFSGILASSSNYYLVKPLLNLIDLKKDNLTGLPTRNVFINQLEKVFDKNEVYTVLLLNCRRFKRINSSFGHENGDELLIQLAERLEKYISKSNNYLARLRADEFAILSLDTKDKTAAIALAKDIQKYISARPFMINKLPIFINISAGIALSNMAEYSKPEYILRDADMAIAKARQTTKSSCFYQFFEADMHLQAINNLKLESELRKGASQFCKNV